MLRGLSHNQELKVHRVSKIFNNRSWQFDNLIEQKVMISVILINTDSKP